MSSSATAAVPGPVTRGSRIESLDVARGAAVLGILLMNIWAFAGPQAFFDYPLAIAGKPGAPVATWVVIHTLFEGSQRGLLSLLFGAGALLLIRRHESPDRPAAGRGIYYRRTVLLILFGLFDSYVLLWPADILFAYGVAGLFLYPLRRLTVRSLLLIALVALAVPVGIRVADISHKRELHSAWTVAAATRSRGATLTSEQAADVAAWEEALAKVHPSATDEKLQASLRVMQEGSLAEIAVRQAGVSIILQTIVGFRWFVLDAFAVMVLGMALYRTGTFTREAPASRYLALLGAGFAVGLPIAIWGARSLLATDFDPVQVVRTKLVSDVRRIGMALGYLGLILLFCRAAGGQWLKRPLATVGRMALTNYLGQSILCGLFFYGFGLGMYGRLTGYQLYGVVATVWGIEVLFSTWWLGRFRIGPFEWVWRSLTYRRTQPFRLHPVSSL